jgi:hypothetical protein
MRSKPQTDEPMGTALHKGGVPDTGTGEKLRGEVQLQIFRSKLLMTRARELLDALLTLARGRRN